MSAVVQAIVLGQRAASAQAAAASKQAELDAKAAAEAEKRTKVGDYIAQKGTAALLGASPLFLKDCKCSRSLCVFFRSLKEAVAQTLCIPDR